jgi:hypothetical protein
MAVAGEVLIYIAAQKDNNLQDRRQEKYIAHFRGFSE